MSAAVPLVAGAALAGLIAPGALRAFAAAGWTRANFRGARLPFPAGAVAVVAGVLALGVCAALDALAGADIAAGGLAALFLGVAFLGLLDDLFEGEPRGWRGHFGAVLRGGFSTGVLKAAGTLALAAAVLAPVLDPAGEFLLAVAVVALATNLFNLLDLRPGRSAKAFVLLGTGLLLGTWEAEPLRAVGAFAGPLVVLGVYDLRERAMLGDTGSNLLGALAGVWLVLALGTTGQAVAAALLLALTVFGEFRSITATVERVPPLRWLDALGRRRAG